MHARQPHRQRTRRRLGQRQFALALEARQRRAQLMGGVADEAALGLDVVADGLEQVVDGLRQRAQLLRRGIELDGPQVVGLAALDQPAQPRDRRQARPDAGPHDHAHQHDQDRQWQHRVDQQPAREQLAVGAGARHLHQHGLLGAGVLAELQVQRGHPHRRDGAGAVGLDLAVVELGLAQRRAGRHRRRTGQVAVAQDELARRRADGVEQLVARVGLEHVLRGAWEVDQQPVAHRLDLARERARGLQQRRVDRLVGVAAGEPVAEDRAGQPQHHLRQQQPQQQLALEREPRGAHGARVVADGGRGTGQGRVGRELRPAPAPAGSRARARCGSPPARPRACGAGDGCRPPPRWSPRRRWRWARRGRPTRPG